MGAFEITPSYFAARPDIRLWKPRGWKDSRPDRFKGRFKGRFKDR
jgi:hypothetical protein